MLNPENAVFWGSDAPWRVSRRPYPSEPSELSEIKFAKFAD